MKKSIFTFTMILAIFFLVPSAFSADVAKIGIVFSQKVMVESSAGKIINKKMGTKRKEIVERMNAEAKPMEAMKKEIDKMKLLPDSMDKNKLAQKQNAFNQRLMALDKLRKQLNKEIQELNKTLMTKFSADLNEIIRDIGKKEGYLMIFDRKEAGIYYAPSEIDITDSVIKILNQKTAETK